MIDTGKVKFNVRPFDRLNDIACVFATWCHYIRRSEPFNRMDPDEFRHHKRTVIERLVARHPPTMAVHEAHPNQILAWCCCDPKRNALHFLFAKEWVREKGVGKALLKFELPWFLRKKIYYTHRSKATPFLERRWDMCYNPYLVMKCDESQLSELSTLL